MGETIYQHLREPGASEMTPQNPKNLKEEFEKAFASNYIDTAEMPMISTDWTGDRKKLALWGAKWMADYLKRPDISKELE